MRSRAVSGRRGYSGPARTCTRAPAAGPGRGWTGCVPWLPSRSLSFPAHDATHELLHVGLGGVQVRRIRALVHDQDPVADDEEVLQPVCYENDRDLPARHLLDQL